MRRIAVALAALLSILVTKGSAQTCSFPWTLTATPFSGHSVVINICGFFIGCSPHNPQFTVSGSQVNITLQSSEPPDRCQCIQVQGTFQESVLIQSLSPGAYTVVASLLSCDAPPLAAGSTTFTLDAASAIPTLGSRGMVVLMSLIAIAGMWLVRR
jgi:hypothetical protein